MNTTEHESDGYALLVVGSVAILTLAIWLVLDWQASAAFKPFASYVRDEIRCDWAAWTQRLRGE